MTHYEEGDDSIAQTTEKAKYGTFDDLVDRYSNGEFGEPGPEAWAAMMETWGRRTKVGLRAGATALSGEYETHVAEGALGIESFDAAVATGRQERLVAELLIDLDAYGHTE